MSHIEEGIDFPVKLLWDLAVKLVLCQTPRRTSISRAVSPEQHDPEWRAEARRLARAEDGRISIDELCATPETIPTRFDTRFVRIYTADDLLWMTQLVIHLMEQDDVHSAVIADQFGRPSYVPAVIAVTAHNYGWVRMSRVRPLLGRNTKNLPLCLSKVPHICASHPQRMLPTVARSTTYELRWLQR